MSCLQLHLLCLLCRRLLSAGDRHLSLWLRTKLLGNCTISHLSFLFSFLANGLLFFLFFHLKEIPCTCQMYCMKVITEPWRKYLNDALVMCCSDNFSFQSTTTTKKKIINYCFIMRMSSCVFILPLHIPVCFAKVSSFQHYQDFFSCKQQNYKIKLVTSCDFTLNHILTVFFLLPKSGFLSPRVSNRQINNIVKWKSCCRLQGSCMGTNTEVKSMMAEKRGQPESWLINV